MGATRKLQGEIDRVLKKVQEGVDIFDSIWNKVYDTENANQKEKFEADLKKEIKKLQRYRDQIKTWIQSSEIKDKKVAASYEQALVDARKQIEREMERFKVCEKETKTKAFSKEGLGQQPKTDPREKAKSEAREWVNNMVDELQSGIDTFEAEMEGLAVKKGKTRPPRLVHLEESIVRHKAHITKLELALRLLDNEQINADQVNEIKDFVEDYVERNQEDFDEFADVDEIYSQLPLEKMEAMESLDAVPNVAPALVVKEKAAVAAASTPNGASTKTPPTQTATTPSSVAAAVAQTPPTVAPADEPVPEEKTAPAPIPVAATVPSSTSASLPTGSDISSSPTTSRGVSAPPSLPASTPKAPKTVSAVLQSTPAPATVVKPKDEEAIGLLARRSVSSDGGLSRSFARPAPVPSSPVPQPSPSTSVTVSGGLPSTTTATVPGTPDGSKRTAVEERSTLPQPLGSPLGNQSRPFGAKIGELSPTSDVGTPEASIRLGQWRESAGQFHGRAEIVPDQKQKFLQKLQQVNQQSSPLLSTAGAHHLPSPVAKQQTPQASTLLQQSFLQQQLPPVAGIQVSQAASVQVGIQSQSSAPQVVPVPAQPAVQQFQQAPTPVKEAAQPEPVLTRALDQQQQQSPLLPKLSEDAGSSEAAATFRSLSLNEDDLKNADTFDVSVGGPGTLAELSQLSREADFTQVPTTPSSSSGPGVIGRKELGAIGDNLSAASSQPQQHDHVYNLSMLDAAYRNLPLAKDSERPRSYVPRNPAVTPGSYPQVPATLMDNPAVWEKFETDVLFFAFYFQLGSYQQYLAARELKKQSWRFHKKYNTWFQRHEEPKVTTDEFEQGTYVYFDFHIVEDLQQGWVQRIKTEFTFEYSYLEDELVV